MRSPPFVRNVGQLASGDDSVDEGAQGGVGRPCKGFPRRTVVEPAVVAAFLSRLPRRPQRARIPRPWVCGRRRAAGRLCGSACGPRSRFGVQCCPPLPPRSPCTWELLDAGSPARCGLALAGGSVGSTRWGANMQSEPHLRPSEGARGSERRSAAWVRRPGNGRRAWSQWPAPAAELPPHIVARCNGDARRGW